MIHTSGVCGLLQLVSSCNFLLINPFAKSNIGNSPDPWGGSDGSEQGHPHCSIHRLRALISVSFSSLCKSEKVVYHLSMWPILQSLQSVLPHTLITMCKHLKAVDHLVERRREALKHSRFSAARGSHCCICNAWDTCRQSRGWHLPICGLKLPVLQLCSWMTLNELGYSCFTSAIGSVLIMDFQYFLK